MCITITPVTILDSFLTIAFLFVPVDSTYMLIFYADDRFVCLAVMHILLP